jgi:hypothetical protein
VTAAAPRVTVLMAVYNGERFLREAIDSILAQTFRDFEFLILDDGSTDASLDIVRSYADPRIRLLQNDRNLGLTRSLNRGIAAARGELIARQDGDDISEPDRLARQVAYLDAHPEIGLLGAGFREMDSDGTVLGDRPLPCDPVGIRWALLFHCPLAHSAVVFRRTVVDEVGPYDERLRYAADRELWSRIARRFPAANLPEYLLRYRVNPWSMTATYDEQRFEGPRVSIAAISRLLGWPAPPDQHMERFRRLESLVFGSAPAIDPAWAGDTVRELLRLHDAFCADLGLPAAERRQRRTALARAVGERLVRAASHRAWHGERSAARRLLREAWHLRPESAVSWRGLKAAAFMLAPGRRPA